jgi:hypothetical protein
VSRIRDLGSGCDFDILDVGSLSDITRLAGAVIGWSLSLGFYACGAGGIKLNKLELTDVCLWDGENVSV